MTDKPIVRFLKNGDKRSIAGVSRAISLIGKNPRLISDLLSAVAPDKEAFNMRALDVIEKATRKDFDLLQPYKKLFLNQFLTLYL